jgi:hypothetical protein
MAGQQAVKVTLWLALEVGQIGGQEGHAAGMLLALPALAPWSQIAPLAFRIEAALWAAGSAERSKAAAAV